MALHVGSSTYQSLQGMALLHWACDRGHLNAIEYLVQKQQADVNVKVNHFDINHHSTLTIFVCTIL